ncbi:MAG TPA: Spy/CpxP family protein refolding chaperone [Candidatus Binatus sp.]|uniref:Spy/CpxP family protein refolding chaperone n=1 Tax=Candidatus Binatus sp. TaxID=2811406 RepID=UPI002B460618|nr:Spy/CpxP family protein refolding chaperone [Candidatus Binatus sp.]HKN13006.1 Spy/CpxP family protein refolding chaperone [Candidatus Binatus sp.]
MIVFTHRTARAASAAATLLGAIVLASPSFAGSTEVLAQASSQQAMASTASDSPGIGPVEARIKDLHKKLHITAAQKPQWDALAQVMRDNAQAMLDLQKQRTADAQTMSAVDVVKSYESVIEAHEEGMKKFVPPFEALYNTMSDAQKKTADSLFRSREKVSAAKQTAANK